MVFHSKTSKRGSKGTTYQSQRQSFTLLHSGIDMKTTTEMGGGEMLSSVLPVSENAAQELAAAMQQFAKSTIAVREAVKKASEATMKISETLVNKRISELSLKSVGYKHKYLKASFLTRWYWRRKYQKADKELQSLVIELTCEELNAN
jgi:hypothetical protein